MSNMTVFLYPGQGAQEKGMGLSLFEAYPQARERFHEADDLLGFPLSRLCFEGPETELNRDLNAQLAVYTVSCIITDIFKHENIVPNAASGYSSGFYAAAYASGCFDFGKGLSLVKRAGEILLEEGRNMDGKMAVVFGLPHKQVEDICEGVGDIHVAIQNTPSQMVISGPSASLEKAMARAKEKDALDVYFLSAEVAYHSQYMKQSGIRLHSEIKDTPMDDPNTNLVSYMTLESVSDQNDLKKIVAEQLSHPVLWVDLIKNLHRQNNGLFVEVGPGTLISRTVRWIDRHIQMVNTSTHEKLLETMARLKKQC